MPFSNLQKKQTNKNNITPKSLYKILKDCVSLQVHRVIYSIKEYIINLWKRVFLFTSLKGSLTIEAALVTTMFMYMTIAIIYFLVILNTNLSIQINMNNVVKELTKNIYYYDLINTNLHKSEVDKIIKDKVNDKLSKTNGERIEEINLNIKDGIIDTYLYGKLLSSIGTNNIRNSHIIGGVGGISTVNSKYNDETECIDMVTEYIMRIPILINQKIKIVQRSKMRAWTGSDMTKDANKVYITKNGQVYHTDKNCKHLKLKITKTTYDQIKMLRNNYGQKYTQCKICKNKDVNELSIVYVTPSGQCCHTDLNCSGLTRRIITIDITQTEKLKECKDCMAGEYND